MGITTTAVEHLNSASHVNQDGQSVVEFLLMLPMLFAITIILIRVNTAIQISIVNQQYAREHALFLAFNSPVYPQLKYRYGQGEMMDNGGYNQLIAGVMDKAGQEGGSTVEPEATTQNISRKNNAGSNEPQAEPPTRGAVRVRNTVSLCTQVNVFGQGNSQQPVLQLGPDFKPIAQYQLSENFTSQIQYCRSPLPPVQSELQ